MIVLRVARATFSGSAGDAVGPLDFTLRAGQRHTLALPTARTASIAARLCAGIVKPTRGAIFVADYDTRLQPPQAKRLVGFVDAAGLGGSKHAFACEVAFRAEVWGLDVARAQVRARDLLAALGDPRDPCARALALALVPDVALLVFDRPAHPRYAARIDELAPHLAVVETRIEGGATRYAAPLELQTARP